MNLIFLILYGLTNGAMMGSYLLHKNRVYEFPFWAGTIALGWFFPQAINGYLNPDQYPPGAFSSGIFFATLCTLALWVGYRQAINKHPTKPTWLDVDFGTQKLIAGGAFLCVAGFFFQWKLFSLPQEVLAQTQWSGIAVKYLFLASVFHFGLLTLWFIYLHRGMIYFSKLLILIIPSFLLLFNAAVLHGRRAGMMVLASYVLISLWFIRRIMIPRWILVGGVVLGLALVNTIGLYRSIMQNRDVPLHERVRSASKASLQQAMAKDSKKPSSELNNYLFCRHVCAEEQIFDFGLSHWNALVFNYVPAQLVGREIKDALMLPLFRGYYKLAEQRYGHRYRTGTTSTGYLDAFLSFGWLGFIKFGLIGYLMGILYRHAMAGSFLSQLLYVYLLSAGMHALTHGTNAILVSKWVYFFALGYPVMYWARVPVPQGPRPGP
jgi:hypothetical protein